MKEDFKIPVLFLIAGLIWISYSDNWLYSLPFNKEQHIFISNVKGYAFVTLSSIVLYVLIRLSNRSLLKEKLNLEYQTEQNKFLYAVLDKVENFIIITDAEGKTTWVNQALIKHTGYNLDELWGQYPGRVLRGPGSSKETAAAIDQAVQDKTSCTVEMLNYKKSGEEYWVNLHIAPLINSRLELTSFLSIQSDITLNRITQAQITEQNVFLKKITWMTSHEIRRPLASILSLIGLMKNGSADDKEECLPMLYQSSEELDEIIRAVNKRINKAESLYSTNNSGHGFFPR